MEITLDNSNADVVVIKSNGRIDAMTVSEFEEKTLPLSDTENKAFILDFSNLVYISSAGLRSILKFAKDCKSKSKELLICGLCKEVSEVFKISGFDLILNIKDDLSSAISSVKN